MNIQRFAIVSAVLCQAMLAQGTAPLLVDVDWLAGHLHDRNLILLHVGPKPEYEAKHIPGARYISLQDISRPMTHESKNELTLELPSAGDLRATLASFGISDDSRIIVYVGNEGTFQTGTRVVFTLDYLGLGEQTSMLNGGLKAWTGAGKPVTPDVPAPSAGKLTSRPPKNLVVDADFVKSLKERPGYRLVDARAAAIYNGAEPTYEKSGHIPGAINIPFSQLTDNQMKVDRDHVAEVFKTAGIKPGDTVVAYCHIGQQASAVIFAARLLGNPVMLYDGSFQDWAINNRGPVEK